MDHFPLLCCMASLCAIVWANPAATYDWYDVNQGGSDGSTGAAAAAGGGGAAAGGGGAAAGGGGDAGATSILYSAAAAETQPGSTDSLVSELLSHTSDDDGLTLDLFNNLAQLSGSPGPGGSQASPQQQDDILAAILDQVAKAGPTMSNVGIGAQPTADTGVAGVSPIQAASNVFNVAQGFAKDADLALAKAQSELSQGGVDSVAEASNSAKAAALVTVASAKAEARSSVVKSRNAYVAALGRLREKVTMMKMIEKRFRTLAVAFSKVRDYAGQALLSLKSMTSKKGDYSGASQVGGHAYTPTKDDILTTVASAKARVAKMKIVEKRFLALAQALAKVRAQTYAEVRDVRKNAISLAKITTAAQAQVNAAVDSASNIVSQAVATARATAIAKAEAAAIAAMDAKSKAETIINATAALVAGAKADAAAAGGVPTGTEPALSSGAGTDYGVAYGNVQQGTSYGDAAAKTQ